MLEGIEDQSCRLRPMAGCRPRPPCSIRGTLPFAPRLGSYFPAGRPRRRDAPPWPSVRGALSSFDFFRRGSLELTAWAETPLDGPNGCSRPITAKEGLNRLRVMGDRAQTPWDCLAERTNSANRKMLCKLAWENQEKLV